MQFIIEEKDRCYALKPKGYIDHDEFKEISNELKSLYLFYDKTVKGFKIPKKSIYETYILLTKKYNWDIETTLDFKEPEVQPQTKFRRKVEFDETLLTIKLFNYQKEDILWGLQRTRYFIASDPGVGKTIESIAISAQLRKEGEIDGLLIIVKNNLTYHWKKELIEYTSIFKEEDVAIVNNINKHDFFDSPRPFVIICPNHLWKVVVKSYSDFDIRQLWGKQKIKLILDESHEFKNGSAQRTKSIYDIKYQFENIAELSATPAIRGFEDWYTQMKILDEGIIPYSENMFKLDIAKSIGNKWSPWGINSYNPDRIQYWLDRFRVWVRKRLKSELSEMKFTQLVKPIYVEMSKTHTLLYQLIKELYIVKYKETPKGLTFQEIENKFPYLIFCLEDPNFLKDRIFEGETDSVFKSLDSILKNWKFGDHAKVQYLDEELNDKIKVHKEKVIVFDNHPMTLDALAIRYKDYHPLVIHGGVGLSNEEIQKEVDKFNDPSSIHKLILLNPQTGGTGLNLNKACKHTIFMNIPSSLLYRQALDRAFRISNTSDSTVHILVFGDTLDERRVKINLKKTEFNDFSFKDDLNLGSLLEI